MRVKELIEEPKRQDPEKDILISKQVTLMRPSDYVEEEFPIIDVKDENNKAVLYI